jgi:7-cyano-7-deazaguanine synthase
MNAEKTTNQAIWHDSRPKNPLAVLCSGGLDSAILLAEALSLFPKVYPLYVRTGLAWEAVEIDFLQRFLNAVRTPVLQPLTILDEPSADVYGAHWSVTGENVPDERSADAAVYLPGRNVLLLAKPLIWCHLHKVPELAMALLASNPFPDAKPEFFGAFSGAVGLAMSGCVRVLRPYVTLDKAQVIQRGRDWPLQHTFSCIHPLGGKHCGHCNKCAERQQAFRSAGVADPTEYSS